MNTFKGLATGFAILMAVLSILLGLTVATGWQTHSIALVQLISTLPPMQFNSALCFIFCGFGLLAVLWEHRGIAFAFGLLVVTVGALTLSQYIFGYDLGIDRLLMEPFTAVHTLFPGRMAPSTAVCFILSGLTLMIFGAAVRSAGLTMVLSALLCAIGGTVILGYAVNLPTNYWYGEAMRMAVHGASGFVLLGLGFTAVWWRGSRSEDAAKWLVASVAIASMATTLGLWQALVAQKESDLNTSYQQSTNNLRDMLKLQLDNRVQALERMAHRWNSRGGTPRAEWDADADAYVKDFRSFESIVLADNDFSAIWSMPYQTESSRRASELKSNETISRIAVEARDKKATRITPAIDLTGGERAVRIIVPVFSGSQFDGEIVGKMQLSDFISASLPEGVRKKFQINLYEDNTLVYSNVDRDHQSREKSHEADIINGGLHWRLNVALNPSYQAEANMVPTTVMAAGILMSCLMTLMAYLALRMRRQAKITTATNLNLANEISRRELIERELQENKGRLQEALEANQQVMDQSLDVICSIDHEGRFTQVSSACQRVWQYSPEELIGRYYVDFVHPDDLERSIAAAQTVMTGIPMRDFENRYIRKEGTTVEVVWSAHWSAEHQTMFCVARDNTERRKAEAIARESEERFRQTFDEAPIAIALVGLDGKWLQINRAMCLMSGYTEAEFMRTDFDTITHHEDVSNHLALARSLYKGEVSSYQVVKRCIHRDGHIVYGLLHVSLVTDALGAPLYFVCQVEDITRRREMEEELKTAHDAALEAVKTKSEFLANMSHEMRTPMNGVIGMTELMSDTSLDTLQQDYVGTIKSSAESLLTIINDILDFSKIEAGMLNFETIDFDLRTTVESVTDLFAERIDAKNLELALFFHPDVPTKICGDPTRLRQVLTNLIGNAIKFTEWGEVVIRVSNEHEDETDAVIRFDIKDTGIGISQEAQQKLFTPFVQADGSTTRRYGGTGLGLAICRQLVEMMNGRISILSEPGHGSTFTFTASFIKQPAQEADHMPADVDLKGVRILIVDDNNTNRRLLIQHTGSWGMYAGEAENGVNAIKKLREAVAENRPYQIAILDQHMPGMEGIELAKLIKADEAIAATNLILMPSYSKRGFGEMARDAGISAYFSKPVRQSQLLECLSIVLSDKQENYVRTNKMITEHTLKEIKSSMNRHILLVEDNEVNQKVALGHLTKLGYRVDVASDGLEALTALAARNYDAVLMDCQMPLMDGYEATAEIRKREGDARHTPIIALTAHAMQGDREKCLELGMDGYVSKPVKRDTLRRILEDLFEKGVDSVVEGSDEEFAADIKNDKPPVDMEALMEAAGEDADMLNHIAGLYLKHTAERMEELRAAVEIGFAGDVNSIAHKCLGSSRTCGMNTIAESFATLEQMGKRNDLNGADELVIAAQNEFERIQAFLEQALKPAFK